MLRAYLLLLVSLFVMPAIGATEIQPNKIWLLVDTKAKKNRS